MTTVTPAKPRDTPARTVTTKGIRLLGQVPGNAIITGEPGNFELNCGPQPYRSRVPEVFKLFVENATEAELTIQVGNFYLYDNPYINEKHRVPAPGDVQPASAIVQPGHVQVFRIGTEAATPHQLYKFDVIATYGDEDIVFDPELQLEYP